MKVYADGKINEKSFSGEILVEFKGSGCEVRLDRELLGREGIHLYVFSFKLMPDYSNKIGQVQLYRMSGPKLGEYYRQLDMREGTYVRHFIDNVSISIKKKKAVVECCLDLSASMSKSTADDDFYHLDRDGIWKMELSFEFPLPHT